MKYWYLCMAFASVPLALPATIDVKTSYIPSMGIFKSYLPHCIALTTGIILGLIPFFWMHHSYKQAKTQLKNYCKESLVYFQRNETTNKDIMVIAPDRDARAWSTIEAVDFVDPYVSSPYCSRRCWRIYSSKKEESMPLSAVGFMLPWLRKAQPIEQDGIRIGSYTFTKTGSMGHKAHLAITFDPSINNNQRSHIELQVCIGNQVHNLTDGHSPQFFIPAELFAFSTHDQPVRLMTSTGTKYYLTNPQAELIQTFLDTENNNNNNQLWTQDQDNAISLSSKKKG